MFLDVDGTLIEIADRPDAAHLPKKLTGLLRALHDDLNGALALVSGRALAAIDRLSGIPMLPAAGLHGLERRGADGIIHRQGMPEVLDGARAALNEFAHDRPGVLIEDKGAAIALHFRRAPEYRDEAHAFVRSMVATNDRLAMVPGKMVFEVKTAGTDKGMAVAAFMTEAPFAGRVPIYVGDDVTDEDAFAQVNRMGGHSIRVGDEAPTAARGRLADVTAVGRWLEAVRAACAAGAPSP